MNVIGTILNRTKQLRLFSTACMPHAAFWGKKWWILSMKKACMHQPSTVAKERGIKLALEKGKALFENNMGLEKVGAAFP